MAVSITIHLIATLWALFTGAIQLSMKKGTKIHKAIGWTWMLAMLMAAISSFWIKGFKDLFFGYSPIHLLSIWVIICVLIAVYAARKNYISTHRKFVIGAYIGLVLAGLGTLAPGRLVHQWIFNA